MEHTLGLLVVGLEGLHGLRSVDARAALTSALGVGRERLLQLVGQAEVIDHEAARLVLEDTVHAGNGLHESVATHGLVGVQGTEAGGVEARQPHVAHDDDREWVLGVAEAQSQLTAALLVADVVLPLGAVVGRPGHDDLGDALLAGLGVVLVLGMACPLGA